MGKLKKLQQQILKNEKKNLLKAFSIHVHFLMYFYNSQFKLIQKKLKNAPFFKKYFPFFF